jgi:tetratricopeptide (TPR) repeat protein
MGLGSPRVERIRRRSHLSAAALVLVLLASIPLLRTLRVRAMDHYLATQRYEDVYYLPPAQWLPVFSLGYREAAANLVWMRGLVYYGEEMVHRGGVQHVLDYGEAIVTLDPDFKAAYRWVNMAGLYNARQELTREDVERTITFLERGVRRFPDDGDLAWEMGATLAYELAPRVDDPDEKQRIHSRATDYLMVAARKGAAPPWLALSNAGQLMRLGRTEQAARHLEEMYATVQDPETRERIRNRIADLRTQAYAEAMQEAHREVEERRREELPYVPLDLYLLVGPRPVVDEAEAFRRNFVPPVPDIPAP